MSDGIEITVCSWGKEYWYRKNPKFGQRPKFGQCCIILHEHPAHIQKLLCKDLEILKFKKFLDY